VGTQRWATDAVVLIYGRAWARSQTIGPEPHLGIDRLCQTELICKSVELGSLILWSLQTLYRVNQPYITLYTGCRISMGRGKLETELRRLTFPHVGLRVSMIMRRAFRRRAIRPSRCHACPRSGACRSGRATACPSCGRGRARESASPPRAATRRSRWTGCRSALAVIPWRSPRAAL
jgi:hypothetical protein